MRALPTILSVLAVWRVTHLLHVEDGPFDIFQRVRVTAGTGLFGKVLDCFYCLSLWVAVPFALLQAASWLERGVLWLALSAAAILVQRIADANAPDRAVYVEATTLTDSMDIQEERL
jgi:hypothetical protein